MNAQALRDFASFLDGVSTWDQAMRTLWLLQPDHRYAAEGGQQAALLARMGDWGTQVAPEKNKTLIELVSMAAEDYRAICEKRVGEAKQQGTKAAAALAEAEQRIASLERLAPEVARLKAELAETRAQLQQAEKTTAYLKDLVPADAQQPKRGRKVAV